MRETGCERDSEGLAVAGEQWAVASILGGWSRSTVLAEWWWAGGGRGWGAWRLAVRETVRGGGGIRD